MQADTHRRLNVMFTDYHMLRADSAPSREEVDRASLALGFVFPDDYREFLLRYGAATVGPFSIFGLRSVDVMGDRWSVVDVTLDARTSGADEIKEWAIVSEDHSGNPVGLDCKGAVWIFDHDFGGVANLAANFEEYLRSQCLGVSELG